MLRLRYMVDELEPAVEFYTTHLGFETKMKNAPYFAMLTRDGVDFILSTPYGPGGAAKPMNDGSKPEAGHGWNQMIINVDDLDSEIDGLKAAGGRFRNEIATGPGGSEVILDDPSGNPVELFQPQQ